MKNRLTNKISALCVSAVVGLFTSSTALADAFEGLSMMRMGAWEVDFSGNVNAFFVDGECDPDVDGQTVKHGLACGSDGVDRDYGNIRDGLLPSWFNFSASTVTPGGIKTAVHLSFQPGSNTDSGVSGGALDGPLGLNSANFRQVFLTFGTDAWGTVKLGRDLGLFGGDAILNDMTLLGVGSGAQGRGHTTLGRIGVGYPYADWKTQLAYTSPNFNGFTVTAALMDPWGTSTFIDGNTHVNGADTYRYSALATDAGGQEQDNFGFEAKVNYAFDAGGFSGNVWASYITQEVDYENNLSYCTRARAMDGSCPSLATEYSGDDSADADGFDVGGKLVIGDFDLVAYYYDGEGIGTTGFLMDGLDATGDERDSDGWYVQGRYRLPTRTVIGLSFGESNLDETDYDESVLASTNGSYNLLETNESWIIGAYHPIGEALNLVVEYTNTESEAHNGNEAEEDALAIGAIMFF